jgi:hypothetical protein
VAKGGEGGERGTRDATGAIRRRASTLPWIPVPTSDRNL